VAEYLLQSLNAVKQWVQSHYILTDNILLSTI
jgi:hypothetical protein